MSLRTKKHCLLYNSPPFCVVLLVRTWRNNIQWVRFWADNVSLITLHVNLITFGSTQTSYSPLLTRTPTLSPSSTSALLPLYESWSFPPLRVLLRYPSVKFLCSEGLGTRRPEAVTGPSLTSAYSFHHAETSSSSLWWHTLPRYG